MMDFKILKKEVVEATANIIGENSAAAKILKEAEKYNDPIFIKTRDTIFVMEKKDMVFVKKKDDVLINCS
jgi:hypothetical protein